MTELVVPGIDALTFLFECKGHRLKPTEEDYNWTLNQGGKPQFLMIHYKVWSCEGCCAKFKITEFFKPTGEHVKDSELHYWSEKYNNYKLWESEKFSCNEYAVRSVLE